MDKKLEIAVVLSAVDKMSRVINQAVDGSVRKLGELQKRSDAIAKKSFEVGRTTGAIGLAIGAPLVYATQQAMKFEESMADVAKAMDLEKGSADFAKATKDVKELSNYLATSSDKTAQLMANLAAGGVAKSEVAEVAKIAGQMSVAFDMAADVAGDKFIKMQNALGTTTAGTKKLVDGINQLADNTAAKESQLVDFMAGGGASVARTLKMQGVEAAAFGASLVSMGKSGEEAGTIMQRFQKGVMNNEGMRNIFNKAGGGKEGLMAILEAGSKLSGDKQFAFFAKFGEYGTAIAQMAQNLDGTKKALGFVADEGAYTDSVLKQFEKRSETTAFKLERAKIAANNAATSFGNALLPVLTKLLQAVTPVIEKVSAWIERNPELTATIAKVAAGLAAFFLVTSGVSFLVGGVAKTVSLASSAFSVLGPAIKIVGTAFSVLGTIIRVVGMIMMANPILLIIGLIAMAAYAIYKNWDSIVAYFKNLWNQIKFVFTLAFQGIKAYILNFTPYGLIYKHWDKIKAYFKNVWAGVKQTFMDFMGWITGLPGRMWKAGKNIIMSIWEGIKSAVMYPINAVKDMVGKIRDMLPFSPAKAGPLRDIHRIRLVETIAENIKPNAMVTAMKRTAAATLVAAGPVMGMGAPGGASAQAGAGGGASVNYSPTINMTAAAGTTPEDFAAMLKTHEREIVRLVEEANRKTNRVKLS